jgi:hypothetical protein
MSKTTRIALTTAVGIMFLLSVAGFIYASLHMDFIIVLVIGAFGWVCANNFVRLLFYGDDFN